MLTREVCSSRPLPHVPLTCVAALSTRLAPRGRPPPLVVITTCVQSVPTTRLPLLLVALRPPEARASRAAGAVVEPVPPPTDFVVTLAPGGGVKLNVDDAGRANLTDEKPSSKAALAWPLA